MISGCLLRFFKYSNPFFLKFSSSTLCFNLRWKDRSIVGRIEKLSPLESNELPLSENTSDKKLKITFSGSTPLPLTLISPVVLWS